MPNSEISHILLVSLPTWGHVRPLCVLAARLATERNDIVVTFLSAPNLLERSHVEISRQFRNGVAKEALNRIRVVSTFASVHTQIFQLMKPFAESYPRVYKTLVQGEPLTCASSGKIFDAVSAPKVVIMDFFAVPQLKATRELTGKSVPLLAWVTGGASSIIRIFGPESLGGLGNFGAKIDAEALRTGKPAEEVGDQIFKHTEGAIVQIPGVPALYDYEFFPQKLPFNSPVSPIVRGGYAFLMESDGAIMSTSDAYERESLDAVRSWFSGLSKPCYAVGPLLPPGYGTPQSHFSEGDTEIESFLEAQLAAHGKHSVLFMSFGTMFWPTVQEHVDEVVEALIERKFPFILCHASPFAKISHALAERVKSSGLGLLTTWSPQQFILNHPATGWFITHAGHGGVMESLASGIPLICWPFDADQPLTTAHLTVNLKVAFELIEVRTGNGLKPLLRTGKGPKGTREAVANEIREVIDACRGEAGQKMRRTAEQLKTEFAKAWEADGVGRTALHAFLKDNV